MFGHFTIFSRLLIMVCLSVTKQEISAKQLLTLQEVNSNGAFLQLQSKTFILISNYQDDQFKELAGRLQDSSVSLKKLYSM